MNNDIKSVVKEEAYKCSKCGLCHSVCPVFLSLKNDVYSPRGRFIVLNNFFNNSKTISKNFIKSFDICLNCNLCKNFCPSNIDSYDVFSRVKNIFSYKYSFYKFSSFYKFMLKLYALKRFLFASDITITPNAAPSVENAKGKIIFFQGCYNKYINPSDKNACLDIIKSTGYDVVFVSSQCCGYYYLSEGNYSRFNSNAKKIKKELKRNYDYIVTSCDTCLDTLKKACPDISPDKIISFDEFLSKVNYFLPETKNASYFKPLIRSKDFSYQIPCINKKGMCSGFENFFALKYKKLSKIITSFTKEELINSDKTTVMTTCNITKQGLEQLETGKRILSFSEFIKSCDNGY